MTIEEAIKNLKAYMIMECENMPTQVGRAYDMAIAALRAQQERENPKPLTLDELRDTYNSKIYITTCSKNYEGLSACCSWIVGATSEPIYDYEAHFRMRTTEGTLYFNFCDYGELWLAYRYKPKEAQT